MSLKGVSFHNMLHLDSVTQNLSFMRVLSVYSRHNLNEKSLVFNPKFTLFSRGLEILVFTAFFYAVPGATFTITFG